MSTTPACDEKLDAPDKFPSAFYTYSRTIDESGDTAEQRHALVQQLRHIVMTFPQAFGQISGAPLELTLSFSLKWHWQCVFPICVAAVHD